VVDNYTILVGNHTLQICQYLQHFALTGGSAQNRWSVTFWLQP